MRRKRIKKIEHQADLDKLYKVFTNAQYRERGGELLIIFPSTMQKIVDRVGFLQRNDFQGEYYYRYCSFRSMLIQIYNEIRFKDLILDFPSNVLSSFVRRAIVDLRIKNTHRRKVTLRTINTSGRLYRLAKELGIDLKYECNYYNVPII